jgi:hypothetical protein
MNALSKGPFRLAAAITLLNVTVATGFSITGLVRPDLIVPTGSIASPASAIFAMYAATRTIPMALAVMLAIYLGSESGLIALGALAGVIQASDVLVGIANHDAGKTIGPLVLAMLEGAAIYFLRARMKSAQRYQTRSGQIPSR